MKILHGRTSPPNFPMQRLSAVVASDFIQTPWTYPVMHPVRCTSTVTSGFPFPSRPLPFRVGSFQGQFCLPSLFQCRYRPFSFSTAAIYYIAEGIIITFFTSLNQLFMLPLVLKLDTSVSIPSPPQVNFNSFIKDKFPYLWKFFMIFLLGKLRCGLQKFSPKLQLF